MKASFVLLFLLASSVSASAQEGRIGVGGSFTYVNPASEDLTRAPVRLEPVVRLQPGERWGVAGAFNWYDTDVDGAFAGVNGELGELRIKPLMGGVGYTLRHGRVRTTFSLVGGPAWNRLRIRDEVRSAVAAAGRDVDDTLDVASLAIRPGAGVSFRVAPRLDLTGFGGYLFNRPKFDVPTASRDVRNEWNADAVVLSVGMLVSIF